MVNIFKLFSHPKQTAQEIEMNVLEQLALDYLKNNSAKVEQLLVTQLEAALPALLEQLVPVILNALVHHVAQQAKEPPVQVVAQP